MNWIFLVIAGLCEVGFTYCLGRAKLVTGMEWWLWMGGFLTFTFVSMGLLAKATQTLPLGTAYPVWTGIGAVGTVIVGILFFDEPATFWRNGQRNEVLDGKDIQESIKKMIYASIYNIVSAYSGDIPAEEWDWDKLKEALTNHFYDMGDELDYTETDIDHMTRESLAEDIYENVLEEYENREELFGKDDKGNDNLREAERIILLKVVDMKWMDHIDAMEQLKQGINLRAYAQKDPVVEYKFEAMDIRKTEFYFISHRYLPIISKCGITEYCATDVIM